MKKGTRKQTGPAPTPQGRPWAAWALNVVLYLINFLLIAFIWARSTPREGGVVRLAICWIIAYILTRVIVHSTKVPMRALMTVALGGLLGFVLLFPK
ncbi:MAG: hypothetical protein C0617_16115 [Desulfuromonas sp.]|uniref:hypothetical protein n=1 Tax=Desulfuromonas sp. TaxID=892 RepID=UPI000CC77006|nr:hypothetical protein [Desulfuromonas sp.]PLX81735.1 MAG: hypothetical protein C0617_16115 [Desulfuromonas sp.]